MAAIELLECSRLEIQNRLDALKSQAERNKLGQFATPTELATEILEYAKDLLPADNKIRFLDPAFGTGSFYSALLRTFQSQRIESAAGFEIDLQYANEAIGLWNESLLRLNIGDFTKAVLPEIDEDRPNLIICNPPYVRHHHLSNQEKIRLQALTRMVTGIKLNGLSGYYCYFLLLSHAWMPENGLAGWLIPSEFMDVNYGRGVKEYLLNKVRLIRIHRFDPNDVQFDDALVSSAVVWFEKTSPNSGHQIEFTYGGTLNNPRICKKITAEELRRANKWTRLVFDVGGGRPDKDEIKLSDLFYVKRGIATGSNEFFMLDSKRVEEYRIPDEFLIPILPSPRFLSVDRIQADHIGNPILEQKLFLLSCDLPEHEVKEKYPALWHYLESGKEKEINNRYLCMHRSPWYTQEKRSASPFICTYMGRHLDKSKPFRFILNRSKAIVANSYLVLYPKDYLRDAIEKNDALLEKIWAELNNINVDSMMGNGRVYGGGLHKIEPKELANVSADGIIEAIPELEALYEKHREGAKNLQLQLDCFSF
ncbi:MAG: SAM-dependent methyltransferase [Candidatus Aquicultor secundus]|uniref:Eco57I restriction-modification methylase domain-containing protein n=1 Tax=Candidatus Aquicultor secundus TaxID=1973895 RepID=UPI00091C6CD1|nr:class I SAM-dependent methyltransferase [Candidatus Aquicultor secundus]OIO83762.1 MAG: SAM-dependent methyltransferase [Candidatus Aquicultor secundus]